MKTGHGSDLVGVQHLSLSRRVDVFLLGQAGQLILIAWQAAEENGTPNAEDGGAPTEAVGPGVVIVTLEDLLVELDGVDDQSDDLENHNNNQQYSYEGQESDVQCAAQSHARDDEGDDQDEEADDH